MTDQLHGFAEPRFQRLRNAFARSFDIPPPEGEIGAELCVYHQGVPVLDLWGGHADAQRERPVARDTLVLMMSVAKGISALAIHMLADSGRLDLDAPVAAYWSEFARHGKEGVLVRHLLDHRAGLAVLIVPVDYYDQRSVAGALENAAPLSPPGTSPFYHSVTMGYLLAELVLRTDGRSLGRFLRDEVCGPLGAQFFIGLQQDEKPRCAEWIEEPAQPVAGAEADAGADADVLGGLPAQADADLQGFLTAEIPSVNGYGEARGVARIYAALANGGELDGVRLLSPAALARATRVAWEGEREKLTGSTGLRMALGFQLSSPHADMGPNPAAFGHPGSGGASGFADPGRNLAFAYAPVAPYPSEQLGSRAPRLIDALYACL